MSTQEAGAKRSRKARRTSNQRLWIVSELYYPEQTSTGYFLTQIAEGLAADYDVNILCGQPTYSERGVRAPREERRNETRIFRARASHFDKDRLVLRAFNLLTITLSFFIFALTRFRRGDRVLVVTNPPTVPLVIGLVARLRGCRAILLVHDVYPEILVATGLVSSRSLMVHALAGVFSGAYRLFDRNIVLGRDMAEVVARKLSRLHERIVIIPNWGDVDEISPIPRESNAFRRDHGLEGKFVVQFSGNIGRSHDVELVLDAARELQGDQHIRFLFVGYGGKSALVERAGREELDNVQFLPRQPRERLGEMLASSDSTVISFVDGMYGLSVPSRMYNVMAAGVPIIAVADARAELSLVVSENGAGWVLSEASGKTLAALLRQLATADGQDEAQRRGRAARKAVEARYTLSAVLDRYRELLAGI